MLNGIRRLWGRAVPSTLISVLAWCLIGTGVLVLAGCVMPGGSSSSDDPNRRVFRVNLATEPPGLDPAKVNDLTSFTVVLNIMRGLTVLDGQSRVQPAVADRWEMSSDGKTYRFYLRQDALWSDGKPVVAQDFVYAWHRVLLPETGAEYAFFLFEIKGARAYYEGKTKDFATVGIKALSPKVLEVRLERSIPFFTALLASPVTYPVRRDKLEAYGDQFVEAGKFVGNGPYCLSMWRHEDQIRLTPNPRFYGAKPQVDEVQMLMINDANTSVVMYENGELDYVETPSSIPSFDVRRLKNRPDFHHGVLYALYYLGFNVQAKPFDDVRVRKAFAHALNHEIFPKLMQSGQHPTLSWIPPGMVGYNNKIGLKYDVAEANRLLQAAGYTEATPFPETSLSFRTLYDIQKEAEIAQSQWKQNLGVEMRLHNMEWKVFLKTLGQPATKDPIQVFRLSWFADYPDPDTFMSMFTADSGNNYTHWHSDKYDALVKEAVVTLDAGRRQALYDEAQRLLLEEEAVIIPLYVAEKAYLLNPRVSGVTVNALNTLNLDALTVR